MISGNAGTYAAGVFISFSTATFTKCTVSLNAAYSYGGLYIMASTATMVKCTIEGNSAETISGGLGLALSSVLALDSCNIIGNTAEYDAGGIYVKASGLTAIGCYFSANIAGYSGSDLYINVLSTEPTFFSTCDHDHFSAGTGSLKVFCENGCSEDFKPPADLRGGCSACDASAPYACCGALECTETAANCSTTETNICPLTLQPSPSPTQFASKSVSSQAELVAALAGGGNAITINVMADISLTNSSVAFENWNYVVLNGKKMA